MSIFSKKTEGGGPYLSHRPWHTAFHDQWENPESIGGRDTQQGRHRPFSNSLFQRSPSCASADWFVYQALDRRDEVNMCACV